MFSPRRDEGPAVLSLEVQARQEAARTSREQGHFEVLVRHLLERLVKNDLLAPDGEMGRTELVAFILAIPGVFASLLLMPLYHRPMPRPFWLQVSDHYFYVLYAVTVMGVVTVYSWELLFPDLLDVFVLGVQPIVERRVLLARCVAVGLFLMGVLLETNVLGMFFFPILMEQPVFWRHFIAHAVAVGMSGIFAAAALLAMQGVLLNAVSEKVFRRISPAVQSVAITILMMLFFLCFTASQSLEAFMKTQGALWFPPFWYLGVYERIAIGPLAPEIFHTLARRGWVGSLAACVVVVVTYPLAHRRKVRHLVESSAAIQGRRWRLGSLRHLFHATLVRRPATRGIFYFLNQTMLRRHRQRVLFAMYAGAGMSLVLARVITIRSGLEAAHFALSSDRLRFAVPMLVFWSVVGMRIAVGRSVDSRGEWVFRVIQGRPSTEALKGTKVWVGLCGAGVGLTAVAVLGWRRPAVEILIELLLAVISSRCLTELFFMGMQEIPFTRARRGAVSDLPVSMTLYLLALPAFVGIMMNLELRLERRATSWEEMLLVLAVFFLGMKRYAETQAIELAKEIPAGKFPQTLGLRE